MILTSSLILFLCQAATNSKQKTFSMFFYLTYFCYLQIIWKTSICSDKIQISTRSLKKFGLRYVNKIKRSVIKITVACINLLVNRKRNLFAIPCLGVIMDGRSRCKLVENNFYFYASHMQFNLLSYHYFHLPLVTSFKNLSHSHAHPCLSTRVKQMTRFYYW